jgi:hypothetical protein
MYPQYHTLTDTLLLQHTQAPAQLQTKPTRITFALDSSFHYGAGELTPQSTHRVERSSVHSSWWKNQPSLVRVVWLHLHAYPPFHYILHHVYIVVLYAPAERADTLPLLLLYPYMYSMINTLPLCPG